jgi:hypothetical protein
MRKRLALSILFGIAMCGLSWTPAQAATTRTFLLELEEPNTAVAANGDTVAITGEGMFSVHPKSVEAEGSFTHTDADGNVLVTGTWAATKLVTYQSYGCGVVFGTPIPPDFCGGKVRMKVLLTPDGTSLEIPATLTVFCVIGDHRPSSAEEGIRLVVPGHVNFNDATGGDNIYIRV